MDCSLNLRAMRSRGAGLTLSLAAVLLAVASVACKPKQPAGAAAGAGLGRSQVVVTIYPLYDLARQVAGPDIPLALLMPPGASEHSFNPSPADLRNLTEARLLIAAGDGVDEWIAPFYHARGVDAPHLLHLNGLLGFPLGTFAATNDAESNGHAHEEGHDHDHDHEVEGDGHDHEAEHHHGVGAENPHQWLVPTSTTRFVEAIRDALKALYPDQAEALDQRAAALCAEISAIDEEYREALAPIADKRIITFHDAFSGMGAAYGVTVSASIFNIYSNQVTPAALQEVTRQIQTQGIRAVFIEPQISSEAARRLGDIVTLRVLDPLGDARRPGYESWQSMMRSNLQNLVAGMRENHAPVSQGPGGGGG